MRAPKLAPLQRRPGMEQEYAAACGAQVQVPSINRRRARDFETLTFVDACTFPAF